MARKSGERLELGNGVAIDLVGNGGPLNIRVDGAAPAILLAASGFIVVRTDGTTIEREVLRVSTDGSMRAFGDTGTAAWPLLLYSETGEELERPTLRELSISPSGNEKVRLSARLQSEQAVGDFAFEIDASTSTTVVDVTSSVTLTSAVGSIGVAPLATMYLFSKGTRLGFDDYRTGVHDADGLWMRGEDGRVAWRSLNNPPRQANSYFAHRSPQAFGFVQRARDFRSYHDEKAGFEQRPSVLVEPADSWGHGFVRLIESPSRSQEEQNMVVSWIPRTKLKIGVKADFRYRLRWSMFTGDEDEFGKVDGFSVGAGGVSGVEGAGTLRKFVVDFTGPALTLDRLPAGPVDAFVTVSPGDLVHVAVFPVGRLGTMRLIIDADIATAEPVELRAYLIAGGRQLTETWVYQWRQTND